MKKNLALILPLFLCFNTFAKINIAITPFCNAGVRLTSIDQYHTKISNCFNGINKNKSILNSLDIVNNNTCNMTGLKDKALSYNSNDLITGIYNYANGVIYLDIEIINLHHIGQRKRLPRFTIKPSQLNEGLNKIVVKLANHYSVSLNDYKPCYKPKIKPKPRVAKVIKPKKVTKPKLVNGSEKTGYSKNVKTAFEFLENGKIDKALAYFDLVEKADNTYYDIQYHMGLCYMLQGNFSMAKNQFTKVETFGNAKSIKDFEEYKKANNVGTVPYVWFNTLKKRKGWYSAFNIDDKAKIIKILNRMGVNNGVFDKEYTYKDEDIKALFQSSYTPLELGVIEDFTFMKNLNNTTLLELHNTRIKSIKGLSYLYKLNIIRTNKKIKDKIINNWLSKNNIKVVYF